MKKLLNLFLISGLSATPLAQLIEKNEISILTLNSDPNISRITTGDLKNLDLTTGAGFFNRLAYEYYHYSKLYNRPIEQFDATVTLNPEKKWYDSELEVGEAATYKVLETSVPTRENIYHDQTQIKNDTAKEQWGYSQAFSKAVTDTKTVTVTGTVEFSQSFKFAIGAATIKISGSRSQSDTHTETITKTSPSQRLVVSPYHIGKINYDVFQNTMIQKGVIQAPINENQRVVFTYFWSLIKDVDFAYFKTIREYYEMFKNTSVGEELFGNKVNYLSLGDDGKLYVNIPVEYTITSGELFVSYSEEAM